MHKKYISKASKIIASSMVMYKDLISRGIDSKKLTILHNPVDVDNIRDIPKTFRKKGKGLRLVAAGRLVYQKGFDRLIPLVGKLNKASNLIIFGGGISKYFDEFKSDLKCNSKIVPAYYENNAGIQINNIEYL